jgi:hypothetical protein
MSSTRCSLRSTHMVCCVDIEDGGNKKMTSRCVMLCSCIFTTELTQCIEGADYTCQPFANLVIYCNRQGEWGSWRSVLAGMSYTWLWCYRAG